MLKKADMQPGSVVEVLPVIKSGIPKAMFGDKLFSKVDDVLEHLSVRRSLEIGSGGWKVSSGEKLEIVEPPKRRQGVNGIKVRSSPTARPEWSTGANCAPAASS